MKKIVTICLLLLSTLALSACDFLNDSDGKDDLKDQVKDITSQYCEDNPNDVLCTESSDITIDDGAVISLFNQVSNQDNYVSKDFCETHFALTNSELYEKCEDNYASLFPVGFNDSVFSSLLLKESLNTEEIYTITFRNDELLETYIFTVSFTEIDSTLLIKDLSYLVKRDIDYVITIQDVYDIISKYYTDLSNSTFTDSEVCSIYFVDDELDECITLRHDLFPSSLNGNYEYIEVLEKDDYFEVTLMIIYGENSFEVIRNYHFYYNDESELLFRETDTQVEHSNLTMYQHLEVMLSDLSSTLYSNEDVLAMYFTDTQDKELLSSLSSVVTDNSPYVINSLNLNNKTLSCILMFNESTEELKYKLTVEFTESDEQLLMTVTSLSLKESNSVMIYQAYSFLNNFLMDYSEHSKSEKELMSTYFTEPVPVFSESYNNGDVIDNFHIQSNERIPCLEVTFTINNIDYRYEAYIIDTFDGFKLLLETPTLSKKEHLEFDISELFDMLNSSNYQVVEEYFPSITDELNDDHFQNKSNFRLDSINYDLGRPVILYYADVAPGEEQLFTLMLRETGYREYLVVTYSSDSLLTEIIIPSILERNETELSNDDVCNRYFSSSSTCGDLLADIKSNNSRIEMYYSRIADDDNDFLIIEVHNRVSSITKHYLLNVEIDAFIEGYVQLDINVEDYTEITLNTTEEAKNTWDTIISAINNEDISTEYICNLYSEFFEDCEDTISTIKDSGYHIPSNIYISPSKEGIYFVHYGIYLNETLVGEGDMEILSYTVSNETVNKVLFSITDFIEFNYSSATMIKFNEFYSDYSDLEITDEQLLEKYPFLQDEDILEARTTHNNQGFAHFYVSNHYDDGSKTQIRVEVSNYLNFVSSTSFYDITIGIDVATRTVTIEEITEVDSLVQPSIVQDLLIDTVATFNNSLGESIYVVDDLDLFERDLVFNMYNYLNLNNYTLSILSINPDTIIINITDLENNIIQELTFTISIKISSQGELTVTLAIIDDVNIDAIKHYIYETSDNAKVDPSLIGEYCIEFDCTSIIPAEYDNIKLWFAEVETIYNSNFEIEYILMNYFIIDSKEYVSYSTLSISNDDEGNQVLHWALTHKNVPVISDFINVPEDEAVPFATNFLLDLFDLSVEGTTLCNTYLLGNYEKGLCSESRVFANYGIDTFTVNSIIAIYNTDDSIKFYEADMTATGANISVDQQNISIAICVYRNEDGLLFIHFYTGM